MSARPIASLLSHFAAPDLDDLSPPAAPAASQQPAQPSHAAYVIYTSGSSGRPKGVTVERRNLTRDAAGALERLPGYLVPGVVEAAAFANPTVRGQADLCRAGSRS